MPKSTPNQDPQDEKLTIRVSQALYEKLQQIAHKKGYRRANGKPNASAVIREAIRTYLDQQDDLIGSRAHFNKSMQDRLDQLQAEITQLIQAETHKITDTILATARPTTRPNVDPTSGSDPDLVMAELSTVIHMQAVCFALIFSRIPSLQAHSNVDRLLDNAIDIAKRTRPVLEAKLRLPQKPTSQPQIPPKRS